MEDLIKMPPKVSVIMPAYNVAAYIQKSIQSILLQTYDNWELLVVDDGSLDETREMVRSFSIKDYRVSLIVHDENQGVSEARNTGLEMAVGKYVCFVDPDDWVEDNYLKDMVLDQLHS